MLGEKFGFLTVLSVSGVDRHRQKKYLCKCDCGKEKIVLSGNLKKGNSTSCGCKRKLTCSTRMSKLNLRHGMTGTKLWRTWKAVVERTTILTSSHYQRYGGAGIGLYPNWLNFEEFASYIGEPPSEKHSIDRINNSLGYFPGNIRWATAKEQAANKKTNIRVNVNGQFMILSDAAKSLGISKSTASRWYALGKFK
jgi:hypothetical protein